MHLLIAAFTLIGGAAHRAHTEERPAAVGDLTDALPKPDGDGFITIFRGDDLSGWRGLQGYWYAKDRVISGRQTKENSKQTFLIFTRFILRDFELQLKYRFALPTGNSGIQFRSRILDEETYRVGGYQADIDASGDDGSIYDEAGVAGGRGTLSNRGEKTTWNADNKRSAVTFANSADLKNLIKVRDWNNLSLIAKSNRIMYSINGKLMTDLVDESPMGLNEGVLALQLHEGFTMEVEFKDVRIKVLTGKSN